MNKSLVLTDKQEIERLRKVIEEKNRAIEGFKKYDKDRKIYYSRFEENYRMMEERFNELNNAIAECEDVEPMTKRFFEQLTKRMYSRRVNDDMEGGALNGVLTRLEKLNVHLSALVSLSGMVEDLDLRHELRKECQTAQTVKGNIVSYVKRKLGKIL